MVPPVTPFLVQPRRGRACGLSYIADDEAAMLRAATAGTRHTDSVAIGGIAALSTCFLISSRGVLGPMICNGGYPKVFPRMQHGSQPRTGRVRGSRSA